MALALLAVAMCVTSRGLPNTLRLRVWRRGQTLRKLMFAWKGTRIGVSPGLCGAGWRAAWAETGHSSRRAQSSESPRPLGLTVVFALCHKLLFFLSFLPVFQFPCPATSAPSRLPPAFVPLPQAAKLPMSIIIVGVGQAEFDGKAPTLLSLPLLKPAGAHPGVAGWPCASGLSLATDTQGQVTSGQIPKGEPSFLAPNYPAAPLTPSQAPRLPNAL